MEFGLAGKNISKFQNQRCFFQKQKMYSMTHKIQQRRKEKSFEKFM
jgi:hypothetical protein